MDQHNNEGGNTEFGGGLTESTGVSGAGSSASLPGASGTGSLGANAAQGDIGGGSTGTSAGTANTPDFGGTTTATATETLNEEGTGEQGGGGTSGVRGQVEERANRLMDRAAEGLESAASRLGDMADRQGGGTGPMGRVGDVAHRAADTMESTARYLRDNDVSALQGDLERMTREKPLQMLLVAVAAGWVLGKVLR